MDSVADANSGVGSGVLRQNTDTLGNEVNQFGGIKANSDCLTLKLV